MQFFPLKWFAFNFFSSAFETRHRKNELHVADDSMGKYWEAGARNYRASSSLHKLLQTSSDWLSFALPALSPHGLNNELSYAACLKVSQGVFSSREFCSEIIFRWITSESTHEPSGRESWRSNLGARYADISTVWYGTLSETAQNM